MQIARLYVGAFFYCLSIHIVNYVLASNGDRSEIFQRCMYLRHQKDCTSLTTFLTSGAPRSRDEHHKKLIRIQDRAGLVLAFKNIISLFFGIGSMSTMTTWSCLDDCKYKCMWITVDAYLEYGERIPQFYGKWPFVRFLGMQEPASAFFSLMNGISTYIMWNAFRKNVPSFSPNYYVWNGYALVSMNAWFWSTIFHSRDNALTEMLDYFSATSCVLYSFYGLCARILWGKSKAALTFCAIVCCGFFVLHVHYLAFVKFDYGYNMMASVSIGMINSLGWLVWCATRWRIHRYVWRCAIVVSFVTFLVILEIADFAPIWWTFDAHSLWHLGTILLPLLWYRFLIDDCHQMLNETKLKKSV